MKRNLRNYDLRLAWSHASSASVHGQSSGAAELNIGSEVEPIIVCRSEAFRDLFSRQLLEALEGDEVRISRLRARAVRALERSQNAEYQTVWAIAVELCDRATRLAKTGQAHGGRLTS